MARAVELSEIQSIKTGEKAKLVNDYVAKVVAKASEVEAKEGQGIQVDFTEVGISNPDWLILGWVRAKLKKLGYGVYISKKNGYIIIT
ncbi:MAG: hypothetical protein DRZ76_01875 [Candidatus Nealsonbacteria bacterium]|nr:MAG: hypothetical protein DRZ76_01875 [Candidatus Nealsonbacteria bacterium]